jgi:hypothetical protein
MCYEYDWMQKVEEDEALRRDKEWAEELKRQSGSPLPKPEVPRTKDPVPA